MRKSALDEITIVAVSHENMKSETAPDPEVVWTTSLLNAALSGNSIPETDLQKAINFDALIAYIDKHVVAALLAGFLKKSQQWHLLPQAFAEKLDSSLHASMARSATQLSELRRILEIFENQGIKAIPWKGPLLSYRIFGDTSLRECSDLDILIIPSSADDAESLLTQLGYTSSTETPEVRAEMNEDHCKTFQHHTLPVAVELHASPFPRSFPFPIPVTTLFAENQQTVKIADTTFPQIAPETELLLLCAHAAKHAWSRLAWIVDIAMILKLHPQLDGEQLNRLARQSRCHHAVGISIYLAETILDISISDTIREHFPLQPSTLRLAEIFRHRVLDPNTPPEGAPPDIKRWLYIQSLRARTRESFRDQVTIFAQSLRYTLDPNENDCTCIPGIRLSKSAAFFVRPFRLLLCAGRTGSPDREPCTKKLA